MTASDTGTQVTSPSSGSIALGAVQLAWTASPCGRAVSEDFFDFTAGEEPAKGFAIALADGLSAPGYRGREASEICVRTLLADYLEAPTAWTPAQILERSASSVNGWLFAENARRPDFGSMLCTLTVLAIRDSQVHFGHVGDSRLYRVREGQRERFTADHVWPCSNMQHVLRRAIGLDRHLVLDCGTDDSLPGDLYLLLSDGVWEVIGDSGINDAFRQHQDIAAICNSLVTTSLDLQKQYLGRNDATAILVKVLR